MLAKKILLKNGDDVKKLYLKSFPDNERTEFEKLWSGVFENFDMFGFFDENQNLIGMLHFYDTTNFVYVNYLAVDPTMQSHGYGSQILQWLKERFCSKAIVLDLEDLDKNSPNALQRERRLKFYQKNGFEIGNYRFNWRGTNMFFVHFGGVDGDEFIKFIQSIYPEIKDVKKF